MSKNNLCYVHMLNYVYKDNWKIKYFLGCVKLMQLSFFSFMISGLKKKFEFQLALRTSSS